MQKLADFWFWGYVLRKFQGELLKPNHVLAFCQASFLMTLSQVGFLMLAPGTWLQSPSAVILEPPKIKSDTVSNVSPSISHEVMGPDAMILAMDINIFPFICVLFSFCSNVWLFSMYNSFACLVRTY